MELPWKGGREGGKEGRRQRRKEEQERDERKKILFSILCTKSA
jgi:hypothetical protein